MSTILLLTIAAFAAVANGNSYGIDHMKNDYFVKAVGPSGHRLAGWTIFAPNNNKCDMVRRHIKTFGYCWDDQNEQRGINTTIERGWVREVVQQWEKCGGIKIVEEPKCREGPDFVTVKVGNYGPVLYPFIEKSTCTIYGFKMLLDFYTFGINIEGYKTTEKIRKSNIQMYALHEFGHFLGFDHEHNRNDRQECYWQVDESEVGPDAVYGNYHMTKEYDLDSIMNYCRPNVHYKPWLSKLDKQAVREAYGGGNQDECDAVTKPWTWGPADGLHESTLYELQAEANGEVPTERPSYEDTHNENEASEPKGCADVASKQDCEDRAESCSDEAMKYWCPKTCNFCQ